MKNSRFSNDLFSVTLSHCSDDDYSMKICEIHIYQHDLPVKNGPYTMTNAGVWSLDTILVKLVTDNGLTGWGKPARWGQLMHQVMLWVRAAIAQMAAGFDRHKITRCTGITMRKMAWKS